MIVIPERAAAKLAVPLFVKSPVTETGLLKVHSAVSSISAFPFMVRSSVPVNSFVSANIVVSA